MFSSRLHFRRTGWRLVFGLGFLCGQFGCGGEEPENPPPTSTAENPAEPSKNSPGLEADSDNSQSKPPNKNPAFDPKQQLRADLDDAVSLLEKGDLAIFFERYLPIDDLREIRKDGTLEQAAEHMRATQPDYEKQMLARFKSLQAGEIRILDDGKSLAIVRADLGNDHQSADVFQLTDPADEKLPVHDGFPGDIPTAIAKAVETLEAGDIQTFVEKMFPDHELHVTLAKGDMEALLSRLKTHPQMIEQMLADLKSLQELPPEFDSEQRIATFQLNPDTPQMRTVRLEKSNTSNTWRFANTARQIRTQMYQEAKRSTILEIKWERIRDHWRLYEIEILH